MSPLRSLHNLRKNLFNRTRMDGDLDDELRAHLDLMTEEKRAAGLDPVKARRASFIEMGGVEQVKEEIRSERAGHLTVEFLQDLRYGMRMLSRNPLFTATAVLALTLGIGANTAVFSVAYGILLRPLPYPDANRVAVVFMSYLHRDFARGTMCLRDYLTWKENDRVFEDPSIFRTTTVDLGGSEGNPEQVHGAAVTAGFFSALGVRPLAGRAFAPGDDNPSAPPLTVLSESIWRRRFGSSFAILGHTVTIDGVRAQVIGVVPGVFQFPQPDTDLWTNLPLKPPTRYGPWFYRGIARLRPGVSIAQAQAEMNRIAALMMRENSRYQELKLPVVGLRDSLLGDAKPPVLILTGTVSLVLLIALVNVANLLLARATVREGEMALRVSLGARHGRLLRQLLTESMLLAAMGGMSGLAVAWVGIHLLQVRNPGALPLIQSVRLDGAVLGFAIFSSILAGIVFGLAPALRSVRTGLNTTIQGSARAGSGSRAGGRIRGVLVISEIAVSLVLLTGAGLLLRSFANLESVNSGFDAPPGQVLTMQVSPGNQKYADTNAGLIFYHQLLQRARAVPGVRSAAVSDSLPPDRQGDADTFGIEGQPQPPGVVNPVISQITASPGFFHVLGIPLKRGRFFDDYDTQKSEPVAIVSEGFARRYMPGEDAIGKRVRKSEASLGNPWMKIVGVVGDAKYLGLPEQTDAAMYVPFAQNYGPGVYLAIRSNGEASALIKTLTGEILALDPEITLAHVETMEEALGASVAQPRFDTVLLALFAGIALLLVAIGIYGLVAGAVAQRTREIGIRMALGAAQADVVRGVIRQGMILAVAGIVLGLGGALGLTRFLKNLLFNVGATDWLTFTAASAGILIVVLLATFIPAFRASRISPIVALRYQ